MGVHINMKMPKSCDECKINKIEDFEYPYCPIVGIATIQFGKRLENCPLTEVPEPHGRLIDADALEDMEMETCDTEDGFITIERVAGRNRIRQIVRDAPTIIPASEEAET